jgi:hypothetical protein
MHYLDSVPTAREDAAIVCLMLKSGVLCRRTNERATDGDNRAKEQISTFGFRVHPFQASRIGYDRNSLRSPYLPSRAGVRRIGPGHLRPHL